MKNSQIKVIEQKLRIYRKPFITKDFLQKIIDKFAPNYKPYQLSARGLLTPIKNWELYLNNFSDKTYISSTSILGMYMQWKTYMIWWLYLYNRYWLTQQVANYITVYNTVYSGKRKIADAYFIFIKVRPSFFRWKMRKQSQDVYYYTMTPERALIQLLIDRKGKPEYKEDIFYQIKKWNIDTNKTKEISTKYCSKNNQNLINSFLSNAR